jgi:hypothetical protein
MGLFDEVNGFLFKDEPLSALQDKIRKLSRRNCLIVVSGVESIRDSTPQPHRWKLDFLVSGIITQLPDDKSSTILWFDSPVPSEEFSVPYSNRCLLPYYENSPINGEANEIIWNLPTAPECESNPNSWFLPNIAKTPYYDDIRVIISQTKKGFSLELTHIPPLINWSKRFSTKGIGGIPSSTSVIQIVPDVSIRNRMEILSLTLIPWIVKLWPTQKLDAGHSYQMAQQRYASIVSEYGISKRELAIRVRELQEKPWKEPTLLERLRLYSPSSKGGKAFIPLTKNVINSQRLFNNPRKLKTKSWRLYQLKPIINRNESIEKASPLYGMNFTSQELGYEWRAIIDPNSTSGLMTGLFRIDERMSDSSLNWSENRLDIVSNMGLNLKKFDEVTESVYQPSNFDDELDSSKWVGWHWSARKKGWVLSGLYNYISRSHASRIQLRAFGLTPDESLLIAEKPDFVFPFGVRDIIVDIIRNNSKLLSKVQYVKLKLNLRGKEIEIDFLNPDNGEKLHSLRMKNTAAIVKLLRWPMTKGKPLQLTDSLSVTWSPVHDFSRLSPDIDFGQDFKFLEQIIQSISNSEGMIFSQTLADTVIDYVPIQITIYHDFTKCPLSTNSHEDHASCWKLSVDSKPFHISDIEQEELEHHLTDKKVQEILDKLTQVTKTGELEIIFDHGSDKYDRLVFGESEIMRQISKAYRGMSIQQFSPGHTIRIKRMIERRDNSKGE